MVAVGSSGCYAALSFWGPGAGWGSDLGLPDLQAILVEASEDMMLRFSQQL